MQSKRDRTQEWVQNHQQVALACIYCHERLKAEDNGDLTCPNRHHFNLSKQGDFHLAKQASNQDYSRDLFQARRRIITEGSVFDDVHRVLLDIVSHHQPSPAVIIDAGCGEGSYLACLNQAFPQPALLGFDLAKAGIKLATDYNGHLLASVADLSQLPLCDQSVDIILSILSPANYQEFARILKSTGLLIKVIPTAHYLAEIRLAMQDLFQINVIDYDNEPVYESFLKHCQLLSEQSISKCVYLSEEQKQDLVEMTPLTWQLSETERLRLIQHLDRVTVDLLVLVGRFNHDKSPDISTV
ncbi:methyltransferase domain-containing protein [Hutsoniella sourekii]|uniref:methyltransferase domain-containing protein n=1 Tax=Hutsoniella sourekii TaxID=87650 RepID=UPI000488693C|nr:methyltransferase domain-containing protein [Hutsoniella sourekii]